MRTINFKLLDEDDDLTMGNNGSGGNESLYDDDDSLNDEQLFDDDGDSEEFGSQSPEDDDASGQQPPQNQGFDYNALSRSLIEGLKPIMQNNQQQQQEQLTPEKFKELTKYYAVQKERVATLFNPEATIEERMEALQEMLDGTATHAVSVAGLMSKRLESQMQSGLAPIHQQQQQQVLNKFITKVTRSSPALKGKDQFVQIAMQQMIAGGYQSQGEAKDIQNTLVHLKKMLRSANPNFKLTKPVRGGGRAGMPSQASSVNGAGGSGTRSVGGNNSNQGFRSIYGKKPTVR